MLMEAMAMFLVTMGPALVGLTMLAAQMAIARRKNDREKEKYRHFLENTVEELLRKNEGTQ